MDFFSIAKIAGPIAGSLANIVVQKGFEFINKTDVQKAIEAGIKAAEKQQEKLPQNERLFYSAKKDGLSGTDNFLNHYFSNSGVLAELQKPLTNQGKPDIKVLTEIFKQAAETKNIKLTELALPNWIETFVDAYFQNTTTYIKFQVTKKSYFRQLNIWFDNVIFAGIDVATQEEERKKLVDIFVMPDVQEEASKQDFFLEENPEKLEKRLLVNTSGRKFLASQLLSENKSQKFVILGGPGSGKTTLMSYFAVMLAQKNPQLLGLEPDTDWLPILIRIPDFVKDLDTSILEHIRVFAEKNMSLQDLPTGFFEHWLEDGRALILLDGLDEVAEETKRYDVVKRIETFLGKFEKNRAIITSRPVGYRRDFFNTAEFPHYQMQSFDDDKISLFLDNWYNSRFADPQQAQRWKESLQKALGENDRIKLLARNPLLLTIIALIHRSQGFLPKRRNELYEKAVETLLVSWDEIKELSSHQRLKHLDMDDLKRLMELLAYWVHTQGKFGNEEEGGTVIDKDDLIEKLNQEIRELKDLKLYQAQEETERFLELIQGRTGLLNEQGQDYYAFVHKTFQEYLCAQEIQYRANDEYDVGIILNCIRENFHDSHWREVLLLLIVEQNPKAAANAIRMILNNGSEYEEWLHRDLLFAGYCLAENPKGMRKADSKLVQEILEALVELEVSKEEQVGDRVRSQVYQIFCSLGETDFEEQALEMLKERSDLIDEERLWGYQVRLGEKDPVIPLFVEKLLKKKVRFWQLKSVILDQISEDVVNALLDLLKDENSDVRNSAVDALRELGNSSEDVVKALLDLLWDDNHFVRLTAVLTLGELANSSEDVVKALLNLLEDENSSVRSTAALALSNLGNSSEEVVKALFSLLWDDSSRVRLSAAEALGNLGNSSEDVVHALLSLLGDENFDVRGNTALALGELGNSSENVINALLELLWDDVSYVRGWAAYALGKLGNTSEDVVHALLDLLWDDDSHVRGRAAIALGELGNISEDVVNALFQLLRNEDSYMRGRAADVLGSLGNILEDVVNVLLELLWHENYFVHWCAANALGKLGKKSDKILLQVSQCIQKHQDSEYLGASIDLLWDLVVGE
ncbi:MAG: NACHT domain-containing protein [Okeania sp. SIO2F4]|uniref:HEAT repeat domain-containing protein n=1 Tax=Okeania sp. SIO2F4 TaxID=2607790 RepID=UPI00142A7962|nr:HEAT repeat domain-containing protein [Okeania sp. SIO2F4]NES05224.1 NACHT domain-containing protein [Okeania sp. SIO2F4]